MSYTPGNATTLIEDAQQRAVSTAEKWFLAKKVNFAGDSKDGLQSLGFTVGKCNGLFYEVTPPEGYIKTTSGYWTNVFDSTGKEVLNQFYKAAPWDTDAFLNFCD